MSKQKARFIYVIFDGPPGPEAGRFVEVEDEYGQSIRVGRWFKRGDDFWALEIEIGQAEAVELKGAQP